MLRYKGLRQFSWLMHKILIIPNESKRTVLIHRDRNNRSPRRGRDMRNIRPHVRVRPND